MTSVDVVGEMSLGMALATCAVDIVGGMSLGMELVTCAVDVVAWHVAGMALPTSSVEWSIGYVALCLTEPNPMGSLQQHNDGNTIFTAIVTEG